MNGQQQVAQLLYRLAIRGGATPQHAREFVSAGLAESTLRPGAVNRSSGAAGIFQLLSSGYRQRAKQLGGLFNPSANARAILPDYLRYWRQHPGAAPGQAGAAVEASGAGAGFYSKDLPRVRALLAGYSPGAGGGLGAPDGMASPSGPAPAPPNTDVAQALFESFGQHHGSPDIAGLLAAVRAHAAGKAQDEATHIRNVLTPGVATAPGVVHLAMGADRAGVKTSRAVLQFVKKLSGLARAPLTIGTGTNHSHLTVNGRVSDHWSGHAADIPATGANLIHLGRLALIAAGADPRWAMRQKGGLFNIGGHQVIFNTHEGGDHTNHLHVSA